jgi:cyclic-di-GMP-binding protein
MPSFDIQCEPDMVKVKNAVDNSAKEVGTRFDFKGTAAAIEIKEKEITLTGDADFQLQQVLDVLLGKLAKQGVDPRFLDKGEVQKIGGDKVRQVVKVRSGIETDQAKKIQKLIKDSKLKVQASIQGDAVRVSGAKRDDLQAAIGVVRKEMQELPLTFGNMRD